MDIKQINWNDQDWKLVRNGIERKAFGSEAVTLALHKLYPGHEISPHSHPNEQVVYILEGEVDFHIGDEVHRVKAGGLAVIPPGIVHYVEVVGDQPAINLDVFTPARPEYEQ
ncbi:cupin domain-containing protein [Pollutimonas thiosulfatoxidans]|uniref:Cupin n=1 Tax=Pollutimonas thiosulfatoxidans TaxID=2028345 RepID=A0A410G8W0_9BURK|nr:cupin domain-containing protein [Pollutimonas thiosulfatoxidans]QAA92645.1 cupin [Pollutimonas thiosulfatoxidans]